MPTVRVALAVLAVSAASVAEAQDLRVIPVPWVATDPSVAHVAYNLHPTTFKAIARGGNGTYLVEWDFDGNGVFDYSTTTSDRYDLSARFTYPNQVADRTFIAQVRVTSNGQTVFGSYPVRVFADVPPNPAAATDRQLQVMRNVAIDDGLWFLHRQLTRAGDETHPVTGAQITGWLDTDAGNTTYRTLPSGSFLESLGMNLHFPAFPAAYLGELPNPAANAARWAADPYAEDAARLVNHLLTQASVVMVTATDESNVTGFYPEVTRTPIAGTDDGIGIWIGYNTSDQTTGPHSNALRGIALAHLAGYVAQVGDANRILGRRFELLVQQLVDGLVWAQNEAGYPGSWYYNPNAGNDMLGEFAGGVLEAEEALLLAERSMGSSGVIVPNLVKARLAAYIQQNQNSCPGGGLGGSYNAAYNAGCDFALTAANLIAYGWVGANLFSASDTRLAFPSYNGIIRGQLRTWYDGTRTFIDGNFNGTSAGQNSWDMGFVEGGDYDRVDGRGDHWSMLHWTRAARAVQPEITLYGPNDHARLFARYLLANQGIDGGWNWTQSGVLGSYSDQYLGSRGRAAWALIVLSREGMAPVASLSPSVTMSAEGAPITFVGSAHAPDADFTWTLGDGETRQGQRIDYAYRDNGPYTVTLTVTNPAGSSSHSMPILIVNAAPMVSAGPDVVVAEGSPVAFAGTSSDVGAADTHFVAWTFGDGQTAATLAASHAYADNGTFTARLRVTDDDGGSATDDVTVTVVNVAPTITSTPPATGTEAAPFSYALTFTDPGASDTHACTSPVKPAGATVTGCTLEWTPTYVQVAEPSPITLCVADDDGGEACQSFQLAVTPADVDADGLPDGWEAHFFGGTAGQGGGDDADLDGVTNADELLAGTDPTSWDGPGVPVVLAPACASKVATAQPTLVVGNALHPRGAALSYDFEVYGDAAATSLVVAGRAIPGGAGYTVWQVDGTLVEDQQYYWRARAGDGAVFGAWTSPACAVIIDAVDAPPVVGPPGSTGEQGPPGAPGTDGAPGPKGSGCSSGGGAAWPALLALVALARRSSAPARRRRS